MCFLGAAVNFLGTCEDGHMIQASRASYLNTCRGSAGRVRNSHGVMFSGKELKITTDSAYTLEGRNQKDDDNFAKLHESILRSHET